MDRLFFSPGQLPQDTDLLSIQKNAMIAIAALSESVLGDDTVVSGFAATAHGSTDIAGYPFAIQLARGFIFSLQEVDPNAYGNLGPDTTRNILKTGISLSPVNVDIAAAAPAVAGQSINYLVSAAFAETDGTSAAVPFVNASNPTVPLSTTINTVRAEGVQIGVLAGTAATTGSQSTPSPPAGSVGLYVVTVTNGQSAVAAGNIAVASGAPFLYAPQKIISGTSWARQSIDGFIEQGGSSATPSSGAISVTFPIPFNSSAFTVVADVGGASTFIAGNVEVASVSKTQANFVTGNTTNANAGPIGFYWEAKGY